MKLPPNTRLKPNGHYYWSPPTRDVRKGSPKPEALGPNVVLARQRAEMLNGLLKAWREGRDASTEPQARRGYGTVAWAWDVYFKSPAFTLKVAARSHYEYRRALALIEDIQLKDGRKVGDLELRHITAAVADKVYAKLSVGPRGKRTRQPNISTDIARHAWNVVHRSYPAAFAPGQINPWQDMVRVTKKSVKAAASREEAYTLAYALREIGEPHLGAGVLICFEWHQRPEHVRNGDIKWTDYRPTHRPDAVFIRHAKTGEKGWMPLHDDAGEPNYPEIDAYLTGLPRLGLPIVLTSGARGPARPYSSEYAQRRIREARKLAGLGSHVTMDTCRHGGLTELGNSGVTEQEGMAASMHRTPQALRGYMKRNETQRMNAASKRRVHVAKNETGARVGMGAVIKSRNSTGGND